MGSCLDTFVDPVSRQKIELVYALKYIDFLDNQTPEEQENRNDTDSMRYNAAQLYKNTRDQSRRVEGNFDEIYKHYDAVISGGLNPNCSYERYVHLSLLYELMASEAAIASEVKEDISQHLKQHPEVKTSIFEDCVTYRLHKEWESCVSGIEFNVAAAKSYLDNYLVHLMELR